ncbi:MAG: DUF4340 domain-containing protein [Rhodospirillales bacterium]|jgi:hypothetical protein|nr:DUF4340 domain-containing protein [Rhodospirillales bacterium]
MTPKAFTGLLGITVVVVAAAVASVAGQFGATDQSRVEQPVLAGFEDKVNSVLGLSVQTAKGTFSVAQGDQGWVVAAKGGYPAERAYVHRLLLQLSQLALVEPKTKMAERYGRIQVEEVNAEDAKSALLSLNDANGAVAKLIVGKNKSNMAGGSGKGVYLRKEGETQAWLARGELDLRKAVTGWLDKDVLDIAEKRIKRITTTSPAGDILIISRDDAEKGKLAVQDVPEAEKLKKDALEGFGAALSGVKLTDVGPFLEADFPSDKLAWAEIVTFDGLVIDLAMRDSENGIWARISASSSNEAGKAEAEKINSRVAGWAYQIPDYKLRPLLKTMADLIEAEKPKS